MKLIYYRMKEFLRDQFEHQVEKRKNKRSSTFWFGEESTNLKSLLSGVLYIIHVNKSLITFR
jgi:hypothetical protein